MNTIYYCKTCTAFAGIEADTCDDDARTRCVRNVYVGTSFNPNGLHITPSVPQMLIISGNNRETLQFVSRWGISRFN